MRANAGNILRLAGKNYIDAQPEHRREEVTHQLNALLQMADIFNVDSSAAESNRQLSPEGRLAARSLAAQTALTSLAAVERQTIQPLAERSAALEKALLAKVTYRAPKDTAEANRQDAALREIRDQLRALPADQRLAIYRSTDDPLILAAVDTAVPTLSAPRADGSRRLEAFIDPDEHAAAKLARAEATDPKTATALREVKALQEVYSHAVGSIRAEIAREAPVALPA